MGCVVVDGVCVDVALLEVVEIVITTVETAAV